MKKLSTGGAMGSGDEADAGSTTSTGGSGGLASLLTIVSRSGMADAGPHPSSGGTGGHASSSKTSTATCTRCEGACVDIETDQNNCGGCGRVCSAFSRSTVECAAGRCLATLASGRQNIWPGLALDQTDVYWTEHEITLPTWPGEGKGRVLRMPLEGGVPSPIAPTQDFPSAIWKDATSVYWTTWSIGNTGELFSFGNASVMRASRDTGQISKLVSVELNPRDFLVYGDIAVDATNLYWLFHGDYRKDYTDGSVLKVSLADGKTTTLASGQSRPLMMAVNAASIYWVNDGPESQEHKNTTLLKMPLAGGAPTTLDVSPSGHSAIAVNATNLYWADYDGTLMSMPLDGGTPTTLATGPSGRSWVATDASSLYWTNRDSGTVMKVPLQGGAVTTLCSGQTEIYGPVVDATSVYWTNGGPANDNKVMKLTPK